MNEQAILEAAKEFLGEGLTSVYDISVCLMDFEETGNDKSANEQPSIILFATDVENKAKNVGWNIRRFEEYSEREIGLMAGSGLSLLIVERGMRTS